MKRLLRTQRSIAIAGVFLLAGGKKADAQLFASVNLDQVIFAIEAAPPQTQQSQTFDTTMVPYQQTATANDGGGFITGAYSLTDNGNVATFTVNLSATLSALNQDIGENDGGKETSTFTLSRPANYKIVITATGDTEEDIFVAGGGIYIPQDIEDTTSIYSGTATPGPIYYEDSFGFIGGGYTLSSATGSVTESFTFTAITPIPEPCSAALVVLPAIALLYRRRMRHPAKRTADRG